jgi:hypothetical protein
MQERNRGRRLREHLEARKARQAVNGDVFRRLVDGEGVVAAVIGEATAVDAVCKRGHRKAADRRRIARYDSAVIALSKDVELLTGRILPGQAQDTGAMVRIDRDTIAMSGQDDRRHRVTQSRRL